MPIAYLLLAPPLCCFFEAVKRWPEQTPAAPVGAAHRLLGHVRFPRLAKHRQVQLETDELALQHTLLIAKAYREELHGEDTPRTRVRYRPGMALEFDELRVGMQVRVMDDLALVNAGCKVPAPGAEEEIGWNDDMANSIGKEFMVKNIDSDDMSAALATEDKFGMEKDYSFPFTVLTKVRPPVT